MDRTNKLAALCTLSFLGVTLSALRAHAQDTPSLPMAPPGAPSNPGSPPAEPSPPPELPTPPATEPAVPAFPTSDPSAAPASPSPEVAPPASSAAFAPLPDLPPKRQPAHGIKPSAPAVDAAPTPAPEAAAAPAPDYHQSSPSYGAAEPQHEDSTSDDEGLFGPIRVGLLVGTGLPDLLSLGGMVKVTRYFGVGANIGLIPTVKLSLYGQATVSFQEYDLYGHIFPFGGAFFVGAGVGYATVNGTLANRYTLSAEQVSAANAAGFQVSSPFDVTSQARVRTLVLTPQIGLLKTFAAGFSIGIDFGAQIPIAPSQVDFATQVPKGVPDSLVAPNDDKVRSTLNSIGRTVLPTVNVKIGWLL